MTLCPTCGTDVHVKSPHTFIDGSAVRLFCSATCMDYATGARRAAPPRALGLGKLFVVGIGVASLSGWGDRAVSFRDQAAANAHQIPEQAASADLEHLPLHGPAEPTEEELALEFVTGLSDHTWMHPLSGPERRMPVRATRAFGAPRPGDRPAECRSGHCGVDLGEVWGEPVFAVHSGTVLKVERRNQANGGRYVRIAHSDGAVTSHYFHLAAIPRHLKKGAAVRTGEVIGIVGDSGVETSGPHLHFAVSVRPDGDPKRQVFVDPEPLVALWPVKTTVPGMAPQLGGTPGVPQGATGHMKTRRHREARAQRPDQRGN